MVKECAQETSRPWKIPYLTRAMAIPMADPQLEFHWLPEPGFLIQGFLIQGFRHARNDFSKNVLPGKSKPPIDELVRPSEATRLKWASALGAFGSDEGSENPAAPVGPAVSGQGAAAPSCDRGRANEPGPQGLFLPGLEGALASMGFPSVEAAMARGRQARAAKARDPRPEVGQREE